MSKLTIFEWVSHIPCINNSIVYGSSKYRLKFSFSHWLDLINISNLFDESRNVCFKYSVLLKSFLKEKFGICIVEFAFSRKEKYFIPNRQNKS